MNKRIRNQIFNLLKVRPRKADEFSEEEKVVLAQLVQEKWVERYGGTYRLRLVLDKPLKPAKKRDWDYSKIQETTGRPESYMNPYAEWLPQLDQGGRGSCCGYSGAYTAWLLQLELIDPKPEKTDVQKIVYDQIVKTDTCNMLVDKKHKWAPSPESVYEICRELEKVDFPAGCWIRGVARALKDWGYNFETTWLTPKESNCVKFYYPTDRETCQKEAENHKIEGYAQIWSYEALKDAIYNYGCAIVAIDIFSNYEEHGRQGPFPEPNGDVIGSHALCAVGYDEKYVYVLHSWCDGFSKIGGFSKNYYTKATGQAYSVLDREDVIIAEEIYGTVTVKTNVPCDITIGKDTYKNKTEAKSSWLVDLPCEVAAVPIELNKYKETIQIGSMIPTGEEPDKVSTFTFHEKDDLQYKIKKFIEELFKKLRTIFEK